MRTEAFECQRCGNLQLAAHTFDCCHRCQSGNLKLIEVVLQKKANPVHANCACREQIERLQDEKEDILDALLLARDMLGRFFDCGSIPMVSIDRCIEHHAGMSLEKTK